MYTSQKFATEVEERNLSDSSPGDVSLLDRWCLGKKCKQEAAANKAFTELLSSLCQLNYVQLRDSGVQNSVTGERWLY